MLYCHEMFSFRMMAYETECDFVYVIKTTLTRFFQFLCYILSFAGEAVSSSATASRLETVGDESHTTSVAIPAVDSIVEVLPSSSSIVNEHNVLPVLPDVDGASLLHITGKLYRQLLSCLPR